MDLITNSLVSGPSHTVYTDMQGCFNQESFADMHSHRTDQWLLLDMRNRRRIREEFPRIRLDE